MIMRKIIWIFFLFSCSQQQPSEKQKVVKKPAEPVVNILPVVQETLYKYADDILRKGLKAEFHYLDTSEKFFWVPPGYPSAIHYDSVAAILRANQDKYHYKLYEWESLFITQLSP